MPEAPGQQRDLQTILSINIPKLDARLLTNRATAQNQRCVGRFERTGVYGMPSYGKGFDESGGIEPDIVWTVVQSVFRHNNVF